MSFNKTHAEFMSDFKKSGDPGLRITGRYVNAKTNVGCECKKCGYSWAVNPFRLLHGADCVKCKGLVKKTPEQFRQELKDLGITNVKLLEDYKGADYKINVQCKVCKHNYHVSPHSLRSGDQCLKCSQINRRKTNKTFVQQMTEIRPTLKLLSPFVNMKTKVNVQCLKCDYIWSLNPNSITANKDQKSDCISCSGYVKKTHKQFVAEFKLKNTKNLTLISKYVNVKTKIKVQCNGCNKQWNISPGHLLRNSGCQTCTGISRRRTHEDFMQLFTNIHGTDLSVLGKYEGAHTKIALKCNVCDYQYKGSPNNLLRGKGCIQCAFHSSARYKRTNYVIGGRKFRLQGYEHLGVKQLIKSGIKAQDIKYGADVPWVKYQLKDHPRRYMADLFIPKTNTLVEIKSAWTMCGTIKSLNMVKAKRRGVIRSGHKFELLVYTPKQKQIKLPANWWTMRQKELLASLGTI